MSIKSRLTRLEKAARTSRPVPDLSNLELGLRVHAIIEERVREMPDEAQGATLMEKVAKLASYGDRLSEILLTANQRRIADPH